MTPRTLMLSHVRPLTQRFFAVALVLAIVLPGLANAAAPTGLLTGRDTQPVNRADFIMAAVKGAGLPQPATGIVPYDNVATTLLPAVRAAQSMKALKIFAAEGRAVNFQKVITRGEAVSILSALTQTVATGTSDVAAKKFTDAKPSSIPLISLALERSWLQPVSAAVFGLSLPLRVKEAQLLLSRAFKIGPQPPSTETLSSPVIRVQINSVPNTAVPKSDLLQQIWNTLRQGYLYQDRLNPDQAGDKAIQGLVNSLGDPYTTYMPKQQNDDFKQQMEGQVEGIGATVEMTGGILRIVSPLTGSPAEKAGLQPKDEILSVDGVSLQGLSLDDAVRKVRGPKDSSSVFHIRRENGTEFDVTITRAQVFIPEVTVTQDSNVTIVKILQFWDTTDKKFRDTLAEVQSQNPRGIILDLRNNPGGLLHAAGVVVSTFLPKNSPYVSIMEPSSTHSETTEDDQVVKTSVPLVILVNKGSASAAEIVTGALQDAKRAKVVGEVTYGKGTVQQVVQFQDGSSLKYTIAEWRTPLGRKIDKLGVTPDVIVKNDPGNPTQDLQMQKAMELLQ